MQFKVTPTIDGLAIADEVLENILQNKLRLWGIVILLLGTTILFFIFGFGGLILGPILYIATFRTIAQQLKQRRFMRKFAETNNFQFQNVLDTKGFPARLFQKGMISSGSNVVIGKYENFPLKLFNYSYTVGSGKHSRTYYFTICEIEIEKTKFPYILLKSRSMSMYQVQDFFGEDKDVQIPLTGGIENTFDLYCTKNYEIETLQIFTQELLEQLKTYGQSFSLEFADNKIYFYDDTIIKNQKDLDQLYGVVKIVLDGSGQLLKRLHDDFEVIHEVYNRPS